MTTQPDDQRTKSDAIMLFLATLLWVLAGTVSVGVIWIRVVGNISGLGYYEGGFVSILGFIVGGIIGGLIARFLPLITKWGKTGRAFVLIVPVLIISPFIFQAVFNDELYLLFLLMLGILGSLVAVWIPNWLKSLWRKFHGAWWVVVVALVSIVFTLFCILMLAFGIMGQ